MFLIHTGRTRTFFLDHCYITNLTTGKSMFGKTSLCNNTAIFRGIFNTSKHCGVLITLQYNFFNLRRWWSSNWLLSTGINFWLFIHISHKTQFRNFFGGLFT